MAKTKRMKKAEQEIDDELNAQLDSAERAAGADVVTVGIGQELAKAGRNGVGGQRLAGVRLSARRAAGKKSDRLNYVLTIAKAYAQAAGLAKGEQVEVLVHTKRQTGKLVGLTIKRAAHGLRLRGNAGQNQSLVFPMLNGLSLPTLDAGQRIDMRVTETPKDGTIVCNVQ